MKKINISDKELENDVVNIYIPEPDMVPDKDYSPPYSDEDLKDMNGEFEKLDKNNKKSNNE